MRHVLAVLLITACGGGNSATPDAPPDMLVDAPEPPLGTHRFVMDKEKVPRNNNEARMFGLDLNNDAVVDNQLGMVIATLSSQGFDSQKETDAAVDRGAIIDLVELVAPEIPNGGMLFTLFSGANAMPSACFGAGDMTCRHHLTGTASFDVAATSARDQPLSGVANAGVLDSNPGHLQIHLVVMTGKPIALNLLGARVRLRNATPTALTDLIVAGGISVMERDAKIYPGMRDAANEAIMRDCTTMTPPDCGCMTGTTGRSMQNFFDTTPRNCTVSLDEIRNNALIQSLFAPDVMVEGQPSLSLGIGMTAVHAGFQP